MHIYGFQEPSKAPTVNKCHLVGLDRRIGGSRRGWRRALAQERPVDHERDLGLNAVGVDEVFKGRDGLQGEAWDRE